jgi:hypothetical protein
METMISVLQYEDRYDNKAQARAVIRQFDQLKKQGYEGVKLNCLSQDEAEEIGAEVQRLRPDIRLYLSWRFGRSVLNV